MRPKNLIGVIIASLSVGAAFGESDEVIYAEDSCAGRCNEVDMAFVSMNASTFNTSRRRSINSLKCTCSLNCMKYSNCCYDYIKLCHNNAMPSCAGFCGEDAIAGKPCGCGPKCSSFNNICCPDYHQQCLIQNVTDDEIEDMAESILFWESDSLSDSLTLNFQNKTDADCSRRDSTQKFLDLQTTAKIPATFFRLKELYNDFVADMSKDEDYTTEELKDQYNFLIPVIQSKVMRGVMNFLILKGFITEDTSQFVTTLRNMWFGLYQRNKNSAKSGSSGFEHVFLGELDTNQVSGFHSWLHFVEEDDDGNIGYNGYLEKLQISNKVSVATINFTWWRKCKSVSSMFIGSSPEFELALYTLCWFTRPNSLCPIILGGKELSIQTYEIVDQSGGRFVSTAYPVLQKSASSILSPSNFVLMFLAASVVLCRKNFLTCSPSP